MKNRHIILVVLYFFALFVYAPFVYAKSASNPITSLKDTVASVERAFAQTMAKRNLVKFSEFIDQDAIFLSGTTAARGKQAVIERWKRYFEAETPPFSWQPETVVVLETGELALSTGPVINAEGKLIAYFSSIWRKQKSGEWKIICDKGNRACPDDKPE